MYRIDNANATTVLPTPLAPGPVTRGFFQSGNPSTGQKATTVDRDWANATQEEICAVIEAVGITLGKTSNNQLLQALRQTIPKQSSISHLGVVVTDLPSVGTSLELARLTIAGVTDIFAIVCAAVEYKSPMSLVGGAVVSVEVDDPSTAVIASGYIGSQMTTWQTVAGVPDLIQTQIPHSVPLSVTGLNPALTYTVRSMGYKTVAVGPTGVNDISLYILGWRHP